jgi:hypothetical protein
LPLDKQKNADGLRRALEPVTVPLVRSDQPAAGGMAPRLKILMADYAASGLPPAYLPHDTETDLEDPDE